MAIVVAAGSLVVAVFAVSADGLLGHSVVFW